MIVYKPTLFSVVFGLRQALEDGGGNDDDDDDGSGAEEAGEGAAAPSAAARARRDLDGLDGLLPEFDQVSSTRCNFQLSTFTPLKVDACHVLSSVTRAHAPQTYGIYSDSIV